MLSPFCQLLTLPTDQPFTLPFVFAWTVFVWFLFFLFAVFAVLLLFFSTGLVMAIGLCTGPVSVLLL